jgi:zinc protease
LEQPRTEPAALASVQLQRQLNPFPKDDIRYVPTIEESIERLRGTTSDQVATLYREYLGSQAGELSIVGDFDTNACLPILTETLRGWKASKPYARITAKIIGDQTGSHHVINTPDKANANYISGMVFPLRDDAPDYPALVMGNYILGGSGTLSSRLGTRVRQKEGLTYGINSVLSVSSLDPRGILTIGAICNPLNIGRVEKATQEELERLLRDGVSQPELDKARQGWLQSRKVSRSSDPALAMQLASLRFLNRTMLWERDLEQKIEALTPEQVEAALRKHVDPKKLTIVTAGDFENKTASSQ